MCAADIQESCVKAAATEGLRSGLTALAISSVVVLGACKLFPRFNRSLNVSARTALIVSIGSGGDEGGCEFDGLGALA